MLQIFGLYFDEMMHLKLAGTLLLTSCANYNRVPYGEIDPDSKPEFLPPTPTSTTRSGPGIAGMAGNHKTRINTGLRVLASSPVSTPG